MNERNLRDLLDSVAAGHLSSHDAAARVWQALRAAPFEDLGFARLDHHRERRQGFPEVILGQGKTPDQLERIAGHIVASGQTNGLLHSNALAFVRNLYATVQEGGSDSGSIVPLLQRLQNVHSNLANLGFVHSNLFNQVFAQVELDAGTAFYIDCGATSDYTDTLGRRWLPDAPYLATSSSAAQLTPGVVVTIPGRLWTM